MHHPSVCVLAYKNVHLCDFFKIISDEALLKHNKENYKPLTQTLNYFTLSTQIHL